METILQSLQYISEVGGLLLSLLTAVYFVPHSPIRRLVETWIEKRVSHQFNKELETHRHRLALEAERIGVEHQRFLFNATLVTERKHEVYREYYKLAHVANGAIGNLYGMREFPTFEDYSRNDLIQYMHNLHFPGKTKEEILNAWESDRNWAIKQLEEVARRAEIASAKKAIEEAWNYLLLNSLYLDDRLFQVARAIFEPLRSILSRTESPADTSEPTILQLTKHAAKLMEELRKHLREELRVTGQSIAKQAEESQPPA